MFLLIKGIKGKVSQKRRDSRNQTYNTRDYPTINDSYGTSSRTNAMPTGLSSANDAAKASLPSDAPPAYTAITAGDAIPAISVTTPNITIPSLAASTADNPYAFLDTFDTAFLIDDSGSMAGSNWTETRDALEQITPICTSHDSDGIDIYFLNNRDSPYHHNVTSAATVRELFSSVQPCGGTPTGQRLDAILRPYIRNCETKGAENVKPLNLIVITDGAPSDDVESPLISAAKKLDKIDAPAWQVGVQFFQVGRDPQAKAHLKALDDELADIAGEDIRDMIDTVPFKSESGGRLTADGILKVLLGAVNRRLDRKKSNDLHRTASNQSLV